jgi:hypothetical protein
MRRELEYDKDGLTWRSDCLVRVIKQVKSDKRRLVIHLPNDGYLYVSEDLLPVMMKDQANDRHLKTCPKGWAILEPEIWAKLTAIEDFARDWFGYDKDTKLRRQIL